MEEKWMEVLEDLVLYGGIFVRVELTEGHSSVFRPLPENEIKGISIRLGYSLSSILSEDTDLDNLDASILSKIKDYLVSYLAHSTVFIDGFNILPERNFYLDKLKERYSLLDYEVLVLLYNNIQDRKGVEKSSLPYLDDFCNTSFSKYYWSVLKTERFNSSTITGIEGFDALPLSYIQLVYHYNMTRKDRKDLVDLLFGCFKFIGSFIDGKAVKQIESKEKQDKLEDIIRRRPYLGSSFGVLTQKGIVDQLNRMKSGELDEHDIIIRREEMLDYQAWRTDFLKQIDAHNSARGNLDMVSFTEEELREKYVREFTCASWLLDELRSTNGGDGS